MVWMFRRGVTLAVALLLGVLLHAREAKAEACSVLDSCGACRNTTMCHWCPDQQCHAVGSIHGCFYGTYCYDNDQCQRQLPEFRGYAAPSIAVLLGVLLVGSTAFVCGIAAISVAREYAKESAATRAGDAVARSVARRRSSARAAPAGGGGEYMMISGGHFSGALADVSSTDEEREFHSRKGPPAVGKVSGRAGRERRSGRGRARGASVDAPGPSPLARKVLLFTRLICGTGMAAALLMCAAVVAFAPHTPGVNVCNTEFDWGSIVHSLKKITVEADFQILVSIYNPNVLDAKIESGTAVLYHKHTEVGTMAFQPAVLEGGYVTDILLTITFDGEAWDDAHLGLEYETGQLAFLMDATVSASVMWHGWKTYPFTFAVHNYYIKVSDTTAYDRSLCNCTQMMQGKRPPPLTDNTAGIEGGVLLSPMMGLEDGVSVE